MSATVNTALLTMFVAVADASSFSVAARLLGVTTATASRDVQKLEHAVGSRLFHRTTRRVAMTTAGAALYERTAVHVRALRAAVTALPEQQEEPAGMLKLTAPYDLGATILGGVVARFTARYPRIDVQAEFGSRVVDVEGEGFDVAIRGGSGKLVSATLTARQLIKRSELQFYAAPSYLGRRGTPRSVGAAEHAWLIAGPLRQLLGLPKTFAPRVIADDFLFLRSIALAGGGVAVLPSFLAEPSVTNGDLVAVLPQARISAGGLVLLHSRMRPLPTKVQVFREFVVQFFEKEGLT